MSMTASLISGEAARDRGRENRAKVLRFLQTETWTHQSVVQELLGFKKRTG